jgi:hypothetical protein
MGRQYRFPKLLKANLSCSTRCTRSTQAKGPARLMVGAGPFLLSGLSSALSA